MKDARKLGVISFVSFANPTYEKIVKFRINRGMRMRICEPRRVPQLDVRSKQTGNSNKWGNETSGWNYGRVDFEGKVKGRMMCGRVDFY
jgi:hypothetical protein